MLTWKFSEHFILCASEHIFFHENISLFDKGLQKQVKILAYLPCYYIVFNLRKPLNREYLQNGQILSFHTIENLFFVLSCFKFYQMNFFFWNLMPWDVFIPEFSLILRVTRTNFQPGMFSDNCQAENLLRVARKIKDNLWINTCHGIKL